MAFGWLILIIIFDISTLLSPMYIKPKYNSAVAKNVLVQGIKECKLETLIMKPLNFQILIYSKVTLKSLKSNL